MTGSYRTYYVNSKTGRDTNDGLTMEFPFASLIPVNRLDLNPGDKVLLARNSVFAGQFLQIRSSGTKEQPIEIGSYSPEKEEGNPPLIAADGQGIWYQDYGTPLDSPTHVYQGYVSSAVLLYDVKHVILRDLEITNRASGVPGESYSAPHKMNRTGVAVVAKDKGTCSGITLRNLSIHDVNGNVYDKHMNNGGIYMTAFKPEDESKTGVARYDGVTVEGCFVKNVSRWGIAVGYSYRHEDFAGKELKEETFEKYGNLNILITGNYTKNIGGDAITPMYALTPLVEHNVSDTCATEMNDRVYTKPGKRMGKVAAAIWPWKCKNALLQYNEGVDTKLNQDGMPWDADSGDGTTYKYNYSRLNEGGCMMFCLGEAVHNTFVNNVSYDDLGGILSPSGNPDAYVADNEFYMRKSVPLKRKRNHGKMTLKNNKIEIID